MFSMGVFPGDSGGRYDKFMQGNPCAEYANLHAVFAQQLPAHLAIQFPRPLPQIVQALAGPPLIGLLGDRVGVLRALLVILVALVLSFAVTGAARPLPVVAVARD